MAKTGFSGNSPTGLTQGRSVSALSTLLEKAPYCSLLNEGDALGVTVLSGAVKAGNEDVVRMLLEKGACADVHDSAGMTPLGLAAAYGFPSLCHLLINDGRADADGAVHGKERGPCGDTPLMCAAKAGQRETMRVLLEHGASVDHGLVRKGDAHHAHSEHHHHCRDEVCTASSTRAVGSGGSKGTVLQWVLSSPNVDVTMATMLLERGASLAECDADEGGDSFMHLAALDGRIDVLLLLVGFGSAVNAVGENKSTPLHYAVQQRNVEAVRVLVSNGADVTAPDAYGFCALDFASGSAGETAGSTIEVNEEIKAISTTLRGAVPTPKDRWGGQLD